MPEITIRRMTMDDVDGVYAVEIGTFVDAWSRDAFVSDMKNPVARYLVAEQDGKIIGYAGAWVILDESHITNIAVLKEHRGQGTGKRLTHGLLQYLSNLGAAYATLEVRRSNEIAQNLYSRSVLCSLAFASAIMPIMAKTRSSWSATTCRRLTRISRKPKRYLKNKQWRSSHDGRFF